MRNDILETLKAVFDTKWQIEENERRIERWRALVERTNPILSDMPKGNRIADTVGDCIAEITTLEDENNRLTAELLEQQRTNQKLIDSKLSGEQAEIMCKRYVECLTWNEIEYQTGHSHNKLMASHRRAIAILGET